MSEPGPPDGPSLPEAGSSGPDSGTPESAGAPQPEPPSADQPTEPLQPSGSAEGGPTLRTGPLGLRWESEDSAAPTGRRTPRSHRAQSHAIGPLLAPLTAVAVVVIVILLLIVINAHPPSDGSAASLAGANSPSPPRVVVPTKTSQSVPPTSTAPTTPATITPASSPPASPSSTTTGPTKPAHLTAMATVQVLNNSRRTGLAHQVAAELTAKGWTLGIVGNLRGAIPVPTVYYSPGKKAAAEHLAHEFSSIQRVLPNSSAGLRATGVTLVLTADWDS